MMSCELEELEHLSVLEEKIQKHLKTVEHLIEVTKRNIEILNEYIDKKYNEIKTLASKKPTRINWAKCEEKMHMSLFFNKNFGLPPSNDDALKMYQYQENFSNYRKKYEYKKNEWTKKDIVNMFERVEELSKKYALQYLVDPYLSYELKMKKRKEIEDEKDVKNIFAKIKVHLEEEEKQIRIGKNEKDENKMGITHSITFAKFSQMFWEEVSKNGKNIQNPRECQRMWLYHACFEDDEKRKWTNEETKKLLILSKDYNERNWKNIAREMNTNRSPLNCFQQYIKVSKMYDKKEKVTLERIAFNVLEDIQLQLLVSILGDKNWSLIRKHMETFNSNSTRIQLRKASRIGEKEKHKRSLNEEISYKRRNNPTRSSKGSPMTEYTKPKVANLQFIRYFKDHLPEDGQGKSSLTASS
ncbi:transcription factor MYB1, putative (MYB1) [Plasmodium ovale curtisi]|uniref:Transcription factor MYB1, putative (MYB1) n=1 Tax=Plasmodium ovale curtisi TaxID=864141 RepID=A0A1A8W5P6_PLAOA|nr:transcription factor MYB1, putative (MYB1) [Plasmodium ovale curtisi]